MLGPDVEMPIVTQVLNHLAGIGNGRPVAPEGPGDPREAHAEACAQQVHAEMASP